MGALATDSVEALDEAIHLWVRVLSLSCALARLSTCLAMGASAARNSASCSARIVRSWAALMVAVGCSAARRAILTQQSRLNRSAVREGGGAGLSQATRAKLGSSG